MTYSLSNRLFYCGFVECKINLEFGVYRDLSPHSVVKKLCLYKLEKIQLTGQLIAIYKNVAETALYHCW
jgi:hypothetical protein